MPKASKKNYYAVAAGREGPKIYSSWPECQKNTSKYPGSQHKGFETFQDAQNWLAFAISKGSRVLTPSSDSDVEPFASGSDRRRSPYRKAPAPFPVSNDSDIEGPTSSDKPQPAKIILSPEQKQVLDNVQNGKNVFFTGSAGTGKSVLLREIIDHLRKSRRKVAITASTGIAAVNIGGSTIHSWAGIGLGDGKPKDYAGKFLGQSKFENVLDRWRSVDALIIDEVSMLDGALFDLLEYIARVVRAQGQPETPFGGIQLILSGDFCQLPPVPNKRDGHTILAKFAFEAETWGCVGPPVVLKKVFRQKDQNFVNMLNEMRFGEMSESTVQVFSGLNRPVNYEDGVQPTELFPLRHQVDDANKTRLSQLPGDPHTYNALDTGGRDLNGEWVSAVQRDRLLERLVVPKSLTLKVGAQVMLLKNLEQGSLVNGSVGIIKRFMSSRAAIKAGISIARIDSGGQNHYQPDREPDLEENPDDPSPQGRVWPVVHFTNGRELLCIPLDFTVNNSLGIMEAQRDQIPLILAWALSIHKSQGQTLERVKVDLGRVFEKGQAYVALSRATNLEHLQVLNFSPSKVAAHPKVLEWYKSYLREVKSIPEDFPMEDDMDDYEAMSMYHNDNFD